MLADEGAETTLRASTDSKSAEDVDAALMRARVLARMFAEHDPLPQIDRFELLEELGRGGMGRVYLAYDPRLDRNIALKRLLGDTDNPARSRMLLLEAQGLARLAHPNVVSVFEVGQGSAGVWIAMEYVRGQTLTRWLETPRTWREIVAVLIAAGRGLAAAHDVDLIHRDFKPSNVLVGADGRPRVLDFGLATLRESLAERARGALTESDGDGDGADQARQLVPMLSGTPGYMAPESFGEGELGPYTDQWAFCVTMYEALCGRRPFAGATLRELIAQVCDAPPRPPEPSMRVPAKLVAAMLRGLAKQPRDRWPSMNALLDELEAQLRPRRLVWPVSLAIALAGVSLALASGSTDPCPRDPEPLAGSWDAGVRARVEQQFAASKLPHAQAAAGVVLAEFERWASDWDTTRHDACVATRVEGVASDALLDARIDCLTRRREALDGRLDELLAASPDALVSHSSELVAALPELDSCAGQVNQRLPTDPVRAAQILAGYRKLERAHTRGLLGGIDQARASIESLMLEPGLAGDLPFELEARLRRAALAVDAHGSQQAIDALHAVALEADAEGLDALELEARLTLAQVVVDLGRTELGAWLLDEARVGLGGRASGPAAAQLRWTQARLAQQQGQLDAAIAGFEATLELDPRLATRAVLLDIGNAHAERGELELARAAYERAQQAVLASWGPDSPSAARIEQALGNLALQAGQLSDARARLEAALTILDRASPGPSSIRAKLFDSFAKLAMNEGDLREAERRCEQALAEFEAAGQRDSSDAATSLVALGVIRYFTGDLEGSIDAYQRALVIQRQRLGDAHWSVGLTRSNLGESLLALDRRDAAEQEFRAALAVLEHSLDSDDGRLALPHKGLGSIALAEGRFEQARARFEQALACLDRAAEPQELADLEFALARALHGAGVDGERALALAEQARTGFDALGLFDRRDEVTAWLTGSISTPTE